ncbi:LLM class flavin-dependent oxidoreductase [Roseomonas elaeocarpi]|uniref:LLM class flavin-dependent oxidoreductase n=1 Tax=Roseomonas elaeocarpi TaxID=907779 RepID=A0ABV6JTN9_9PROT
MEQHHFCGMAMPFSNPVLSILDQSPVLAGRTPAQSIADTLALARRADALGYRRYWVSEHHNSGALAGSAPEILVSAIAATTERIRVGSAGVMLPHYSALKVAEQFRVLDAIAPGRIDLGLGRAPGSDGRTAYALNPLNARQSEDLFPQQLRDVMGWLGDGLPVDHPFAAIRAQPEGATRPEVWMLGSSDYGAQVAAYFGLPYCFAYFFADGRGADQAMALYRDGFRPGVLREPRAAICVFAVAAETEEEARRQFRSRELQRTIRERGEFVPVPPVEEAEAFAYTEAELARIERMHAKSAVGTGEQVWEKLRALSAELRADEVAVVTACHDPMARIRSYELLAAAAGLGWPVRAAAGNRAVGADAAGARIVRRAGSPAVPVAAAPREAATTRTRARSSAAARERPPPTTGS